MRPEPDSHLRPGTGWSARQRGFGLVAALFLTLVVAAAIAAMARLASIQTATVSLGLQQARAYQAARAGLEWGIARALGPGNPCDASPPAFALGGFSVSVSCTDTAPLELPEEGGQSVVFYTLTATAEYSSVGSPDYVYRRLTAVLERGN